MPGVQITYRYPTDNEAAIVGRGDGSGDSFLALALPAHVLAMIASECERAGLCDAALVFPHGIYFEQ